MKVKKNLSVEYKIEPFTGLLKIIYTIFGGTCVCACIHMLLKIIIYIIFRGTGVCVCVCVLNLIRKGQCEFLKKILNIPSHGPFLSAENEETATT